MATATKQERQRPKRATAPSTPLEAAREYLARGWQSVPIEHGKKGPRLKGWQNLFLKPADLPRYFNGKPQNIGVLLGQPSGYLADVDLDCDETMALADRFLPPTPSEFGRASKRRSHRLYIAEGAVTERFSDNLGGGKPSTLVELRSTGSQTVFPGSTHPSGEAVTFDADGDPAIVDAAELRSAVARLASAALLVLHGWTQDDAVAAVGDADA